MRERLRGAGNEGCPAAYSRPSPTARPPTRLGRGESSWRIAHLRFGELRGGLLLAVVQPRERSNLAHVLKAHRGPFLGHSRYMALRVQRDGD